MSGFNHERFLKAAQYVRPILVARFGHLDGMQGKDGAAFCASDRDGTPIHTVLLGEIPRSKRRKYHFFAEEKGMRQGLLRRYTGHVRSRDSADDDLDFFAGGICVADGGYQISGYPSAIDEVGSAFIAYIMGVADYGEVMNRVNGNVYLTDLHAMIADYDENPLT